MNKLQPWLRTLIATLAGAAAAGFWTVHDDTRGAVSLVCAMAAAACFSFFVIDLIKVARESGRREGTGRGP